MSSKDNLSSITDYGELVKFFSLKGKGESRNTEFKTGNGWTSLQYKITKALLGLSNLKDGGKVIVGIKDDTHDSNQLIGMTEEQSKTYTLDKIMEFVNEYAEPSLEIGMDVFGNNDKEKKYFVVINVLEFSNSPIICKKDGDSGTLKRGKMYTRPSKGAETTDNFSYHDMCTLLDLAIMKHCTKQRKICKQLKELDKSENANVLPQEQFDKEVSDF